MYAHMQGLYEFFFLLSFSKSFSSEAYLEGFLHSFLISWLCSSASPVPSERAVGCPASVDPDNFT